MISWLAQTSYVDKTGFAILIYACTRTHTYAQTCACTHTHAHTSSVGITDIYHSRSLLLCCYDETLANSNLEREGFVSGSWLHLVILHYHGPSEQGLEWEPRGRNEVGSTEQCCLLAYSTVPQSRTTCPGWHPSQCARPSHINQDKAHRPILGRQFLNEGPSHASLVCVSWAKTELPSHHSWH